MPPLQESVTMFQRPGARGLIANAETRNLISRSLAPEAEPVLFGVPVYRGATDDLCSGDANDGAFLGLSRRAGTTNPLNTPVDSYAPGDEVPIMPEGVMWVETGEAVVAGEPAAYDPATGLWAEVGGDYVAVPDAEFDTATTAAGLAKVRVLRTVPA